jgi:hypothetical protein
VGILDSILNGLKNDFDQALVRARQKPQYKVKEYRSAAEQEKDINKLARQGLTVVSETSQPSHINVGRTVTGAVLTGGLSLLAGGSRTSAKQRVTYQQSYREFGEVSPTGLPVSRKAAAMPIIQPSADPIAPGMPLPHGGDYQRKALQSRAEMKARRRVERSPKVHKGFNSIEVERGPSLSAEIRALKNLLDNGTLTPEEFVAAKRKLLG